MIFTGKNLVLVRDAVLGAQAEIRMQIGSCPDVIEYEEQLQELDAELLQFDRLLKRIDKAIEREQTK